MTHNTKYILWMLSVALFAVLFGLLLVDPGPIKTVTSNPTPSRGGRSVTAAPAPPGGRAPGTVNGAPSNGRGGRGATAAAPAKLASSIQTCSQLKALLGQEKHNVSSVTFVNGANEVLIEFSDRSVATVILPEGEARQELRLTLEKLGVGYNAKEKANNSTLQAFGPTLLMGLIMIVLFAVFVFSQKQSGGLMSTFGKSRSRQASELDLGKKVTFDQIGGCDEAIKELKPIAKGLKRREVFKRFNAQLPKGILLIGPPGTGKTMLAKAVAGECDGMVSILSGSDFVEMFVGVGAARARDEFRSARTRFKKTGKTQIIFIDEIDAIGGKRGPGTAGNRSEEREQTLNAILVEMDGMEASAGIVVIAATNRFDMLDEALLRQGRFDCHVFVDRPDRKGREKIFSLYLNGRSTADGVTAAGLAEKTYGYTGADIAGVCNRAALCAAERFCAQLDAYELEHGGSAAGFSGNAEITEQDFDEGIDFVKYGSKQAVRQSGILQSEKENTAVHEAGHACVADVMPESDPIVKVTIVGRGKALGYVKQMPQEDRYSFNRKQAISRIVTMMAGRAAQEVLLDKCDSGAQNDFDQATELARRMVMRWGMSRIGPIAIADGDQSKSGLGGAPAASYGQKLADEVDTEWRRICDECFKIAKKIIEADRDRVAHVAKVLQQQETLLQSDWIALKGEFPSKIVGANELDFNPAV